MSILVIVIIVFSVGLVVSGILLLKQSAKKFHLSDEQLKEIKERNKQLDEQEQQEADGKPKT